MGQLELDARVAQPNINTVATDLGKLAGTLGPLSLNFGSACFAAGTKLMSPNGPKIIEEFKVGDPITSRNEFEPGGELEVKLVEEVFRRTAPILNLHVGGQVIRTTGEHPFFKYNKGWLKAAALIPGDRLLCSDGQWVVVEDILDTGEWEVVYNLRVADFHTYFVTDWDWGFSVWSHNTSCGPEGGTLSEAQLRTLRQRLRDGTRIVLRENETYYIGTGQHRATYRTDGQGRLQSVSFSIATQAGEGFVLPIPVLQAQTIPDPWATRAAMVSGESGTLAST